jgi:hypothetical protein
MLEVIDAMIVSNFDAAAFSVAFAACYAWELLTGRG